MVQEVSEVRKYRRYALVRMLWDDINRKRTGLRVLPDYSSSELHKLSCWISLYAKAAYKAIQVECFECLKDS
jgi:hypothetical protein